MPVRPHIGSQGVRAAGFAVDEVSPGVVARAVIAAIARKHRVACPAGRRGGVGGLTRTEEPVSSRRTVARNEVILIPVPGGGAIGRGYHRPIGLPEQPRFGTVGRGDTHQQANEYKPSHGVALVGELKLRNVVQLTNHWSRREVEQTQHPQFS